MLVRFVREVWRGLGAAFGETLVVLDSKTEVDCELGRGDLGGFFAVGGDLFLVFVVWAGGDFEDVFVCHGGCR